MDTLSFKPILLLSAPRIAGYLPAHVTSPLSASFTYTNPRLATLPPARHEVILSSVRALLDIALKVAHGDGGDLDLMLAQSAFYDTVGGQPLGASDPTVRTVDTYGALLDLHGGLLQ